MLNKFRTLKKLIVGKALLISYGKIQHPPKVKSGYTDIDIVAKRYKSAANTNLTTLMENQTIKDNFYFLESECKKSFVKLNNQAKIIDIGCGDGLYSRVFQRKQSPFHLAQYFGCEIDQKLVDVCACLNPKGKFFVSLADEIKSTDNNFDLVFCSSTIHYTLENWKESIKEMARVSKDYLAITRFPVTKYSPTFYVHQKVRGINGTENHYFIVINRKELENFCEDNNLELINRDYSSEEYRIEGVEEKIMLVQYLFRKKHPNK